MEINNESLGQTVEKVICDISHLDTSGVRHRSIPELEIIVNPLLVLACKELPLIVKHVGLERGDRGGQSKSTIDFYCKNGETISVKSTKTSSHKVCPSECGQPGRETFDIYFGHLYQGKVDYNKFKQVCLSNSYQMIPIYLDHLFDCDYLLWVYFGNEMGCKIIKKKAIPLFKWDEKRFSFSKSMQSWNESCTVYYDSITIGEYQAHNHRNCYKFRFNLKNLCRVLGV